MIDLPALLILGLALWRVSNLFVWESGPARIFVYLREWAGIQHDSDFKPTIIPNRFLSQLLGCVWCFSMWAGIILYVGYLLIPHIMIAISVPLAVSALAIMVDTMVRR